jgi:3,4-dihydroxy-2-butanone 4-phosphate synthase
VLLRGDADREDEADLIAPTGVIDVPVMTQLIRDCSGIVCLCLCLAPARVARLVLRRMVEPSPNPSEIKPDWNRLQEKTALGSTPES